MTGSDPRQCPTCGNRLRSMALFCPHCGTAVLPSIDNTLRITVEQILGNMKPGQAEVMRRCAIPRWLDVEILGVLRERTDGNEKILEQIAQYSFVREVMPGRYTFTSDVRDLLREHWRDRPGEFRPILKRLYAYFERRMTHTASENRSMWLREIVSYDLLLASTTANEERTNQQALILPSTVVARTARALLRFRSLIESALKAHRLAEAEAMLLAAEEHGSVLSADVTNWLTYYRANINYTLFKFNEAIDGYNDLLSNESLDIELRTLSMLRLGDVQVETSAWSAAIRTYREALTLPGLTNEQEAAAHLGLADAYNELAVSSGGWHATTGYSNQWVRWGWFVLYALILIPMRILVSLLQRLGVALPSTEVLWRYQNWFLARIFRASREEVQAAAALYAAKHDHDNLARCEMRLVDSDILFDRVDAAIARARRLLDGAQAQDPYRRARYQLVLAQALLAGEQLDEATELVNQALTTFEPIGDVRWQSRSLTLLGRIAVANQDGAAALGYYQRALKIARETGSVLNRERTLYELRVWRRTQEAYPPEIDTILLQEPDQRFVGRLPTFLLPPLRSIQTALLPAVLLVAAILTPRANTGQVLQVNDIFLEGARTYTFPVSGLIASLVLIWLAGSVGYTLLAVAVLWRMPLAQLQQNQPEVVELDPERVTLFNSRGEAVLTLKFADIQRMVSINREFWRRPLSMFSRTFLEDTAGRRLRIDGIISWYNSATRIISRRIQRQIGPPELPANYQRPMTFRRRVLAFLRSENIQSLPVLTTEGPITAPIKSVRPWVIEYHAITLFNGLNGVMLWIGLLGLGWIMAASNGWVPNPGLFMHPTLFSVLQLVGYSGILTIIPLVSWIVMRPLALIRQYNVRDRTSVIATAFAFGVVLFILFLNQHVVRVPIFRIMLFLTSMFLLSEVGLLLLSNRIKALQKLWLVRLLQVVIMTVCVLMVITAIRKEFYNGRAYAYTLQGNEERAFIDRVREADARGPLFHPDQQLEQGAGMAINNQWQNASPIYEQAIKDAESPFEEAIAYHNLATVQLQSCKNKSPECPGPEVIIENEQRALQGLTDPEAQSIAHENEADAYLLLGDPQNALDALLKSQTVTNDRTRKAILQERIDRLQ